MHAARHDSGRADQRRLPWFVGQADDSGSYSPWVEYRWGRRYLPASKIGPVAETRSIYKTGIDIANVNVSLVCQLATQRLREAAQAELASAVCDGEGAAANAPSEIMLMKMPRCCSRKSVTRRGRRSCARSDWSGSPFRARLWACPGSDRSHPRPHCSPRHRSNPTRPAPHRR